MEERLTHLYQNNFPINNESTSRGKRKLVSTIFVSFDTVNKQTKISASEHGGSEKCNVGNINANNHTSANKLLTTSIQLSKMSKK